jgi:PAS domain S-box-containing protein
MPAAGDSRHATADPAADVSAQREARLRIVTLAFAAYALLGGLTSFAGWAFDLRRLTDWIDSGVSIQPNAALAVACAGAGLLLLAHGRRRAAEVFGVAVALLGGVTVLEWITRLDFGVDDLLLFGRTWGRVGVVVPGRMGPPGSLSWTLIGLGLVLAARGGRGRAAVPPLMGVTMGVSLLALIGYAFGSDILYMLPRLTVIALQTSTFVMASSLALLLEVRERPPVSWLSDLGPAGTLVRRAAPLFVFLPIALGSLSLLGFRTGAYDFSFGIALRTVVEIGLLLGLLGWSAAAIDRQRARAADQERAARAMDERLTSLLGGMSDAFCTFDADWRFTFVNDEGLRRIGRPREEVIGRSIWELFPEAVGSVPFTELQRAMAGRVPVEYEYFHAAWRRWLHHRAYPAADGGLALFARDVTERKETGEALLAGEHRFRGIFENVAVSLWEGDLSGVVAALDELKKSGVTDLPAYFEAHPEFVRQVLAMARVLDVNEATITLFKARNREEILGRLPDVFGAESQKALAGMLTAVAEGRPRFESEASLCTLRGDRLYVFFTMVLPPSGSSRQRALFSAFDLTERRHHELERGRLLQSERQAREEAERASQVKDEFLATLSHELRTPLNAILGWVRILEKRPDDPATATEAIGVISRNARAQAALIADLLDMNRIMTGKIRLDLHEVPLDDAVSQAIEAMRPSADAKQVVLQAEIDHQAGTIRVDASRLQQILWNLLSNAVKFTPKGGRIRVRLTRIDSQAEIAVIDTGAGISPKFLPYVFDRFRQADSSTTREHGGLGLGLAIVKNLVDLHGGTVRAESAGEGRGATFTLRLPLEETALPAGHRPPGTIEEETATAAPPSIPEEVDLEGVTILAVDDQPDARDLLKVVLERCNARVVTAASADEALRVLEHVRPDIVLCDIGMPGKDGYGFIRDVRHRDDPTPALAVTAFAHKEDRIRALRAGYQGQIAKPVEPAELISTVAAFVRMARDGAAGAARKRNA